MRTISLHGAPLGIAVDERLERVYVAALKLGATNASSSTNSGGVIMLDAATGAILHTTPLPVLSTVVSLGLPPPGAQAVPMAVDAATGRVFFLSSGARTAGDPGRVYILDAVTGRLLRTLLVPPNPYTVAVDQRTDRVFVTQFGYNPLTNSLGAGRVLVLDGISGHVLALTGPLNLSSAGLAIDERANRVFLASVGRVFVFDATRGTLLRSALLDVTGCTSVVDEGEGVVVVGDAAGRYTTNLGILDATSGRVIHRITLDGSGACPGALDETTGHAFLVSNGIYDFPSTAIATLDLRGLHVVRTVGITNAIVPAQLAVDSRTSRAFVAAPISATQSRVLVLDTHSGRLLATVTVGAGPPTIALDEQAGRVFVANYGAGTVSMLNASVGGAPQGRLPVDPVSAVPGTRYFPRTGHNMSGPFLAFWQRYGGVPTFGYPRTEPFMQSGHLVQYTDRFELELLHGQVQTGPLGRLLTTGRSFPPIKPFPSTSSRMYFPATGHSLSGRFLTWWRAHNGATLLGKPISEVMTEGNGDGSGRRYPLQWFENGRLEYHPELAGTRYAVELGLLGVQALQQRGWLP